MEVFTIYFTNKLFLLSFRVGLRSGRGGLGCRAGGGGAYITILWWFTTCPSYYTNTRPTLTTYPPNDLVKKIGHLRWRLYIWFRCPKFSYPSLVKAFIYLSICDTILDEFISFFINQIRKIKLIMRTKLIKKRSFSTYCPLFKIFLLGFFYH